MEDRTSQMTSSPALHRLIGRALTDRRFREALLCSPKEAIREYPFTPQERELIASVRAASLEEFSRLLDERGPALSGGPELVEGPAACPEVHRRVEGTGASAREAA